MTGCECKSPGYCHRHGVNKGRAWHRLCQTSEKHWQAWEEGRGAGQVRHVPGLGDYVAAGLEKLGITKQRVSRLLGRPCKCRERQRRLNELGRVVGIGRGQAATAQPPSSNKSL
jgi:hypothetical protein